MTEPRRGRGRRDNGLDAPLWSPLRDVDPRVGEHLLDVLREAGIAAYLEPAADVSPYTRTVHLPSPPSDRLFVDRARSAEARGLVDTNADEHARRQATVHRPLRRDLDEDAEWRRIVAALEAEQHAAVEAGDADPTEVAPAPPPPPPPPPPAAAPAEPDPLDVEEHYEPPPPPPLRAPSPASLYAVLLIAFGALLVIAPQVVGLGGDVSLLLGVAGVAAGVAVLVSRMRERSVEDGDDGAVV